MPLVFLKTPNIKFMKYKYIALAVTGAIVLAGVLNVTVGKGLKLGVDFGGGTLIRVMFKTPAAVSDIRQTMRDVGLGNSTIQATGKAGHEFQIRTMQVIKGIDPQKEVEAHEQLANRVIAALKGDDGQAEIQRGLKDFNTIDTRELTSLLSAAFPTEAAQLAEKIVGQRGAPAKGIFTDYAELAEAGIQPEVITFLKDKTFLGKLTVISKETVGPQAGADLRRKATLATIWALIGMLVYIAFRFKLAYGVAAIFTLTQDVLITLSIYSFTNREINLPIIAAVLTIVGFSINDTIVIFDRVRENTKILRKESLENIMNVSLNQCLGRTIITTGTVFITLLSLYIFGGEVINDFAFCMLIGAIEGVYSTVALSCPVVLFWQNIFKTKTAFRK
ncbi:MAG: protein translocase subunit SecF [Candidatus Aminicenantes bacterium]|nr:protein translocase subunit SecF [Candidatus Aminicenantes bacterium]